MSEPGRCPSCDADFDGGPIPENIRQYYSPPYRWSRRIAIYCRDRDRTVAYRCPDCAHEGPTEQRLSADAMLAARKENTDAG